MADTRRSLAALQTLLADNTTAAISEQDLRDFLVSCLLRDNDTDPLNWTDIADALLPDVFTLWHRNSIATVGNVIQFDYHAAGINTQIAYQNPALTDNWTQNFVCRKGRYKLITVYRTWSDHGKYQLKIDGVSIGAVIDQYSASEVNNVITTITNIDLLAGRHSLTGPITGKNASSSNYYNQTANYDFIRTGAYGV